MHLHGFDLNLLIALDTLLNERSVTRAAERLHITQPALSNQLQRIRNHFGDQLLVRHGQVMKLTPLALELLIPVREFLSKAGDLLKVNSTFDPSEARRTFRIVMSDYCAALLLPSLIKMITRDAPGIKCEVESLSEHTISRLQGGDVDMLICAQDLRLFDTPVDHEALHRKEVFSDRFVCAVAADHPETQNGLSMEAYLSYPHVGVRLGERTISIHEHAMRTLGLDVHISFIAPSFFTLLMVLPDTRLIATIPERFASYFSDCLGIKLLPCPIVIPDVVETLYWHRRLGDDTGHSWLREAICTVSVSNGMDAPT